MGSSGSKRFEQVPRQIIRKAGLRAGEDVSRSELGAKSKKQLILKLYLRRQNTTCVFSSIWLFNKFCKFEFLYNCRVSFLFRTAVVRNRLFFEIFSLFSQILFSLVAQKKKTLFFDKLHKTKWYNDGKIRNFCPLIGETVDNENYVVGSTNGHPYFDH